MKELTIDYILSNDKYQLIDVRSPIEYKDSHIPGAINIPLFTDAEREEIGTLYKQSGSDEAKWRAMEVVSPKIPALMTHIRNIVIQGKEPAIYCWRGGSRSKAVSAFAILAGLSCVRVIGGYRAYRQHILERMGPDLLPPSAVVLHGLTGVGKTELLKQLESRGWPVLNLEAIANHRGSVFGDFGHWLPHNQKMFDSLLYNRLQDLKGKPFFIVEAESKRIGKAAQPEFLMEAKKKGFHILLEAPLTVRVERIYKEYVEPNIGESWIKEKATEALKAIQKRMSPDHRTAIQTSLEEENYKLFIHLILEHYYDPMYFYKVQEYIDQLNVVDITDMDQGVIQIEHLLHEVSSNSPVVI